MFDEKTIQKLQYYVYALIDSRNNKPFYLGKGKNNRVFDHIECALENPIASDKYEKIREVVNAGSNIKHIIIKHLLNANSSFTNGKTPNVTPSCRDSICTSPYSPVVLLPMN